MIKCDSLRPLHLERIDFLGAYVPGDQRSVVGREPEPLAITSGGPASDPTDISYGFDLAIARPKSDDLVTLARLRDVLKVYVLSVVRPHRKSHLTVAWFCPTLRGGVEKHQIEGWECSAGNVSAIRRPMRGKEPLGAGQRGDAPGTQVDHVNRELGIQGRPEDK